MEPTDARTSHRIPIRDYDLAATLTSGQAFRWREVSRGWESVVEGRWVRLESSDKAIHALTVEPQSDWNWLHHYLQSQVVLADILATFPEDPPLREAVNACRGVRLLRQDAWETLAGFILSSTKQIVQIQQCIEFLCQRAGKEIPGPVGTVTPRSFPTAADVAEMTEPELRACRMGFRAPYLLQAARAVADERLDLSRLHALPTVEARRELMNLHGVGRKIADCVLLFAYGRQDAFPADVWILKILRHLYFPRRAPTSKRLQHFLDTHFGPYAGYAQQYLFHHARMHLGSQLRTSPARPTRRRRLHLPPPS